MKKIFITATDTDAGKTYAAQAIVNNLVSRNNKVAVHKPVSAGCYWVNNQLVNEDALLLQAQSNVTQPLEQINPIAFEPAIAPHIAASQIEQSITISALVSYYQQIPDDVDFIVTEGAGGWRLPLGQGVYLSDFCQQTEQQIILVVNMKLGCLNHALLTYQAITQDNLNCIGWIANCIEDMPYLEENIAELTQSLPIAMLGRLQHCPDINTAAKQLNLDSILL
jgi:dethiobiotin synthetase